MRRCGVPGLETGDGPGEIERGAESRCLEDGASAELPAGDPAWEAEVVADHRAGAGLSAERLGLEDQRVEALRGAVDGRPQPGRAGTDDRKVEHRRRDVDGDAERRGELSVAGIGESRGSHHLHQGLPALPPGPPRDRRSDR